jgi:hypothetical protein
MLPPTRNDNAPASLRAAPRHCERSEAIQKRDILPPKGGRGPFVVRCAQGKPLRGRGWGALRGSALQPSASCFGLPGRGVAHLRCASVMRPSVDAWGTPTKPCTAWFCPAEGVAEDAQTLLEPVGVCVAGARGRQIAATSSLCLVLKQAQGTKEGGSRHIAGHGQHMKDSPRGS